MLCDIKIAPGQTETFFCDANGTSRLMTSVTADSCRELFCARGNDESGAIEPYTRLICILMDTIQQMDRRPLLRLRLVMIWDIPIEALRLRGVRTSHRIFDAHVCSTGSDVSDQDPAGESTLPNEGGTL
jgi:hypothetical protein